MGCGYLEGVFGLDLFSSELASFSSFLVKTYGYLYLEYPDWQSHLLQCNTVQASKLDSPTALSFLAFTNKSPSSLTTMETVLAP
jgi:hypothetical protein